jgi:16S rRNA (uracil1498-N3)-methyltransferase
MRTDFEQFYVPPDHVQTDVFYLVDDEYRHAVKVLRKRVGDPLAAIDGCGTLYEGTIQRIEKNRAIVSIDSIQRDIGEANIHLAIFQAIPKGHHFDLVIEKGTEIGVAAFVPILTERSIVDPSARLERWRHKVRAATKQCGRSRCPEVKPVQRFQEALEKEKYDSIIIAHQSVEQNSEDIYKIVRDCSRIAVFIGPEGGFTESEFQHAKAVGAIPMNLGKRRLKSETAALVAACQILSAAGELG